MALLHEVLSSRRHRTWSPAYEQIMIAYLNLCLKLHKAREAKDGLHQYRNLAQSQAPGSLEKVIRYLLVKAEDQCSKAKAAAAVISESQPSTMESSLDEDGIAPQAILLSSMSTDPAKNQRDSKMVLPSLKFLWEIYRAVLDILRSNSKLEHVYHFAATGALRFCQEYQRRTEFRRLCDMLRMHLGNLQKYGDETSSKPNNKVSDMTLLISHNKCIISPRMIFEWTHYHRFEVGRDGPTKPSSYICRLDLLSWKQQVFCTSTQKDLELLKTYTTFCRFRISAESKIRTCHLQRPSLWPSTMSSLRLYSGFPKTTCSMHLHGSNTTPYARSSIRAWVKK